MTSMESTFPAADDVATERLAAETEPGSKPPINEQSPVEWVKANLFNSKLNSAITIVLTPIFAYFAYRFFRFVFITGRWEPVETNLTLFMVGQYPREELWRTETQVRPTTSAQTPTAAARRAAPDGRASRWARPIIRHSSTTCPASSAT